MIGARNPMGMALHDMLGMPRPRHAWDEQGPQMTPQPPMALPQDRMDVLGGQPPHKGGFFAEGGLGRILAGSIGDALLHNAGMGAVYAPAMQQQRQAQQEEVQWTRRNALERQQHRNDQQWSWDHKPEADDAFTRSLRNAGIDPASPQGRAMYLGKAQAESDPVVALGDGRFSPRSMLAGMTGAAAPTPRRLGPIVDTIPGGGVGNGPGGFRR